MRLARLTPRATSRWLLAATLLLTLTPLARAAGVARSGDPASAEKSSTRPATRPAPVILATTTSTQDSGLLDALIQPFEGRSGITVKVIAVGSGQALALAEKGEADLVLSHAPEAEERFMAQGSGLLRRRLMYNDFVVVGPPADPAGVRRAQHVVAALEAIAASGVMFVSRGDDSGTHQLEKKLWALVGLKPAPGAAYLETGQGMGGTLRIASENGAYTLADRGTYLSQKQTLLLDVLFEGDLALRNVYHLIVVNPHNGPRVNVDGARVLARYLLSQEAVSLVRDFGRERFGRPLFVPDAEPYGTE